MEMPNTPVRVLVVDRRAIVRAALESLVAGRSGFEIVAAAPTDTACLEAARRDRPDVLLLSVGSDTERAFTFLTSLRGVTPSVRTLLLTDATDRDLHQDAIRLGVFGVMSPESSPGILLKALDCIGRGEYWIDGVTAAALAQASRGRHHSASDGHGERFATLTVRERDIVALIADGLRNKEISVRLNISETTVRHHLTSIFAKLHVSDRLALVVYAFRNGLVATALDPSAGRAGGARLVPSLSKAPAFGLSKRAS
jgi:DNA-binding NarL/FixJ family response regulator